MRTSECAGFQGNVTLKLVVPYKVPKLKATELNANQNSRYRLTGCVLDRMRLRIVCFCTIYLGVASEKRGMKADMSNPKELFNWEILL